MVDPITAISKVLENVFPSTIGAFISLRFLPEDLNSFQRFFALLSSLAIGSYFGRGVSAYLNITNPHISDAILFGTALFGLSFVGQIFAEIKPFIETIRKYLTK